MCRDTVVQHRRILNRQNGSPGLRLRLTDPAAAACADMIARFIGQLMEVRLTGATIAAPIVTEPVTGGRFASAGQREGVLRDSEDILHADCA